MKCCCFLWLWEVEQPKNVLWRTGQQEKTLALENMMLSTLLWRITTGVATITDKVGCYEELSLSLGQKVKVFPTCARSLKISVIKNKKKKIKKSCLVRILKGNWIPLNWLYGNLLNHWFVVFCAKKRRKIPQNHTKSVTELQEVRVADVTENSHLDTPQLLSWQARSR